MDGRIEQRNFEALLVRPFRSCPTLLIELNIAVSVVNTLPSVSLDLILCRVGNFLTEP